jgi:ankyrin repeat protein
MAEILGDLHAESDIAPESVHHCRGDVAAYMDPAEIVQKSPELQLVRVFNHLIQRTLDLNSAIAAVIRLTQTDSCLEVLRRWLGLPHVPVIPLFARQLIVPAARDGHVALVKSLVECGVDPNQTSQIDGHRGRVVMTALQYAVFNRRTDLTQYLLRHGATDWRADIDAAEGSLRGTLLDAIIERTSGQQHENTKSRESRISRWIDRSIFEMILASKPRGAYSVSERSLRTLRLAVLRNRKDYVGLLFHYMPGLKDDARIYSWILLEAAASVEGQSMFTHLVHLGLDAHATDSARFGSALASAVSHSNNGLIHHLVVLARVDPNTVAFGLGDDNVQEQVFRSEERLRKLHGLAPLHIAVQKNDHNAIDLLISHGADPNLDCGAYPIQLAAYNGNIVVLEKLLAAGAILGTISSNMTVSALISPNGKEASKKLFASRTALQIAFELGFIPAVDLLCRRGGQLQSVTEDSLDSSAWDPLHIAIRERNSEMVRYVLAKMYDDTSSEGQLVRVINARKEDDVATELIGIGPLANRAVCQLAVMCAGIMLRKTVLVEHIFAQMMSAGVESIPAPYARRALILAIRERQESLVFVLLTNGLNPFDRIVPGEEGLYDLDEHYMFWRDMSAFECAVEYKRINILNTLLGLTPHCRHSLDAQRQLGAAYGTAICTDDRRLSSLVLGAGLRKDKIDDIMGQRDYIGGRLYTKLQKAVHDGDLAEVEWCIETGAKPDPQHLGPENISEEWTPLQSAAGQGNLRIVKELLRAGADVNALPTRRHGRTALQAASEADQLEIVRLLLEWEAEVNALPSMYDGRTAIEAAAHGGHIALVSMLLKHGADISGKHNEAYRRSVYRTYKNGHQHVCQLIQSWKVSHFGVEDIEAEIIILQTTKLGDEQETEDEINDANGNQEDYEDAVIEIENDSCSSDGGSHVSLNGVVPGDQLMDCGTILRISC